MSFSSEIENIRQNYDTSNPVIAAILKAKEERLKILQEMNKQHQAELNSTDLLLNDNFKKESKPKVKKQRKSEPVFSEIRRSARLQNSPKVVYKEADVYKAEEIKAQIVRPPNDYGPMPGVEVGTWWETRMECSMYGVHRPTVAGIHGGPEGAYSIALSGGYPEDVDEGNSFIYTGAGGRELKGTANKPKNLRIAPQTKDQELEGSNLSLVKSIESKRPIRVIRGYKSPSIFAPESGYRYDGLYQVVKYWEDIGKTGFRIYRFKMERIKDQAPPPWESKNKTVQKRTIRSRSVNDDNIPNLVHANLDYKENIKPSDIGINVSEPAKKDENTKMEVNDFDHEIKLCIDFFFRAFVREWNINTGEEGDEEDFKGWDPE